MQYSWAFPWALAAGQGALRKIKEAALAGKIEKLAIAIDCIPRFIACVMDEMASIQKHKGNHTTFAEFANTLFRTCKAEANE